MLFPTKRSKTTKCFACRRTAVSRGNWWSFPLCVPRLGGKSFVVSHKALEGHKVFCMSTKGSFAREIVKLSIVCSAPLREIISCFPPSTQRPPSILQLDERHSRKEILKVFCAVCILCGKHLYFPTKSSEATKSFAKQPKRIFLARKFWSFPLCAPCLCGKSFAGSHKSTRRPQSVFLRRRRNAFPQGNVKRSKRCTGDNKRNTKC